MIIHPPTNIPCFPLCKYCTNPITEGGLKTKRGQYYHLDCYEQYWHDIITTIKILAQQRKR